MRAQANLYIPKTISIGISTFPEDASDISSLIEKADQALYEAKRTGKNRYCLAKK
jgi:diguanylate cyclase (GGDEF)-like protein